MPLLFLRRRMRVAARAAEAPAAPGAAGLPSEAAVPEVPAGVLPRIARSRSFHVSCMALAVGLVASSCTKFDPKAAIEVHQVPVDLAFGVDVTQFEPKPPPPPPVFRAPTPLIPPPLQEFIFLPTEYPPCFLKTFAPREDVEATPTRENNSPREGSYLYTYEYQLEGQDTWTKTIEYRDLSNRQIFYGNLPRDDWRPNISPNNPPQPSLDEPIPWLIGQGPPPHDGVRYKVSDGVTGLVWYFHLIEGEVAANPDTGLFLDGIGVPPALGKRPDHDDATALALNEIAKARGRNLLDGNLHFTPGVKLIGFPANPGGLQQSVNYDPFHRKFLTSRMSIEKIDRRVRACDELVSTYKVKWDLSIGDIPDVELLAIPSCNVTLIRGLVDPVFAGLIDGPYIEETIRRLELNIEVIEDTTGVDLPNGLFDMLADAIHPVIEALPDKADLQEQFDKALATVCNGEGLEPTIRQANETIIPAADVAMSGTFWFVTQWGGWPVKEDFTLKGGLLAGHFKSNIRDIEPVE